MCMQTVTVMWPLVTTLNNSSVLGLGLYFDAYKVTLTLSPNINKLPNSLLHGRNELLGYSVRGGWYETYIFQFRLYGHI